MRIVMGLEYNGSHYSGWQRLSHSHSVQQTLEEAISSVANETVQVICAGRTDSGVHALGQVVHFDTTAQRDERAWLLGVNSKLPDDISVHFVRHMNEEFHARYSAVARNYRYIILNRLSRPAIWFDQTTWIYHPLDHAAMHEAAQALIGEHDFSAYRAAGCQSKTPNRNVHAIQVARSGEYLRVDVTANAFLHHMVRNIVGVLIAIGSGDQPVQWAQQVLQGRDRTKAGITAPAQGLYLRSVDYPEQFDLPDFSQGFEFFS